MPKIDVLFELALRIHKNLNVKSVDFCWLKISMSNLKITTSQTEWEIGTKISFPAGLCLESYLIVVFFCDIDLRVACVLSAHFFFCFLLDLFYAWLDGDPWNWVSHRVKHFALFLFPLTVTNRSHSVFHPDLVVIFHRDLNFRLHWYEALNRFSLAHVLKLVDLLVDKFLWGLSLRQWPQGYFTG